MSLFIAGAGWVTPLGSGLSHVWSKLCGGEESAAEPMTDGDNKRAHQVFRVPSAALTALPPHPRLRRASAISRFAAAAGLAALENAKPTVGEMAVNRMALIFAIANGGVIYTRRFFHDIVTTGAQAASPLLFPETVFNAPASHLAAILGIEGASYTIVGDGAVGGVAVKMADDLLANDSADYCLVVAAEEADWLLCDAYRRWRLVRSEPPMELFRQPARGTILSEGAGAVLIGRSGAIRVEAANAGTYFSSRTELAAALEHLAQDLAAPDVNVVVGSANGTFIDQAERQTIPRVFPRARAYSVKPALGDSVGASAMWQIVAATQILATRRLPPQLHAEGRPFPAATAEIAPGSVIVLSSGMNQQVAGLRLSM